MNVFPLPRPLASRLFAGTLSLAIAASLAVPPAARAQAKPPAKPAASSPSPAAPATPAATPAAPVPAAAASTLLPETVATVNGEPIKRDELEKVSAALLGLNGRSSDDLSADERKKLYRSVTEELVTDRLVAKQAASVKVPETEVDQRLNELKANYPAAEFDAELKRSGQTVADLKKNIRAEIQQQRWMESQIADQVKVPEADIEKYYQENPDNFKAPETVRASHILVRVTKDAPPEIGLEKENLANSLRDRAVNKKESFADLAKQFSDDAGSKDKGGDLGFFSRERMVPEFADAAFAMKKDEVSKPVRSAFGYHVIKVTDRQPPRTVPLTEARENIKTFLETDKRRQAASQLIAKLHEGAKIQINVP